MKIVCGINDYLIYWHLLCEAYGASLALNFYRDYTISTKGRILLIGQRGGHFMVESICIAYSLLENIKVPRN